MSDRAVQEVLTRASREASFREQLGSDAEEALNPYLGSLTPAEAQSLSALPPEILSGLPGLAPRPATSATFKEKGALILTIVLVLIFVPVLAITLIRIGSDPRAIKVGDTTQSIDEYARAKDVLGIVLPLFGAAITFWLGVAIEGRRADEAGRAADRAVGESRDANRREQTMRGAAADALGQVHGALEATVGATGSSPAMERPGGGAGSTPDLAQLQAIVARARDRMTG